MQKLLVITLIIMLTACSEKKQNQEKPTPNYTETISDLILEPDLDGNFGTFENIDAKVTKKFSLKNETTIDLFVNQLKIENLDGTPSLDFSLILASGCQKIDKNKKSTCSLRVSFNPKNKSGSYFAILRVKDASNGVLFEIPMQANVTIPTPQVGSGQAIFIDNVLSPLPLDTISFDNVAANSSKTIYIKNNTSQVIYGYPSLNNNNFNFLVNSCGSQAVPKQLGPGGLCRITVNFSIAGKSYFQNPYLANITFGNSSLPIQATISPPAFLGQAEIRFFESNIDKSTLGLNWGVLNTNQSITKIVTVKNIGTESTIVSSALVDQNYTLSLNGCLNKTLSPGQGCTVRVNFSSANKATGTIYPGSLSFAGTTFALTAQTAGAPVFYNLTIHRSVEGITTGTYDGGSFICSTYPCEQSIPAGKTVEMFSSAQNSAQWQISSYTQGCVSNNGTCSILMNNNKQVDVNFNIRQYTVSALASIPEAATLSSNLGGFPLTLDYGTLITITSATNSGYLLNSWTNCSQQVSDLNVCELTVSEDVLITANYQTLGYQLVSNLTETINTCSYSFNGTFFSDFVPMAKWDGNNDNILITSSQECSSLKDELSTRTLDQSYSNPTFEFNGYQSGEVCVNYDLQSLGNYFFFPLPSTEWSSAEPPLHQPYEYCIDPLLAGAMIDSIAMRDLSVHSSSSSGLKEFNGKLYFTIRRNGKTLLMQSNGTSLGTNIVSGAELLSLRSSDEWVIYNGKIYFITTTRKLYSYDGTSLVDLNITADYLMGKDHLTNNENLYVHVNGSFNGAFSATLRFRIIDPTGVISSEKIGSISALLNSTIAKISVPFQGHLIIPVNSKTYKVNDLGQTVELKDTNQAPAKTLEPDTNRFAAVINNSLFLIGKYPSLADRVLLRFDDIVNPNPQLVNSVGVGQAFLTITSNSKVYPEGGWYSILNGLSQSMDIYRIDMFNQSQYTTTVPIFTSNAVFSWKKNLYYNTFANEEIYKIDYDTFQTSLVGNLKLLPVSNQNYVEKDNKLYLLGTNEDFGAELYEMVEGGTINRLTDSCVGSDPSFEDRTGLLSLFNNQVFMLGIQCGTNSSRSELGKLSQ